MSRAKKNNQPKLHVRKGDKVRVLSGRDRGKEGKIQAIVHKKDKFNGRIQSKAIVEGINMVTKHRKPDQQNPQGAIIETEAPINVDKLMLIDPKSGEPTRIGRQKTEKGWVRVSKKSGEIIG